MVKDPVWTSEFPFDPDTDTGNRLLPSMIRYFEKAAWHDAARLGFSKEELNADNLTWVMVRFYLKVENFPSNGMETVKITTYPHGVEKNYATRAFTADTPYGIRLISSLSSWMMMDMSSRKAVALPKNFESRYHPDRPDAPVQFQSRMVPRLRKHEWEQSILTTEKDIDVNGHVNNKRYLEWMMKCVESNRGDSSLLREADLMFRSECFADTPIVSRCACENEEPYTALHSLNHAGNPGGTSSWQDGLVPQGITIVRTLVFAWKFCEEFFRK